MENDLPLDPLHDPLLDPLHEPYLQREICSLLNFEDAFKLLHTLNAKTVDCPFRVIDKFNQIAYLQGINPLTIEAYRLIKRNGIKGAVNFAVVTKDIPLLKVLLESKIDTKSPWFVDILYLAIHNESIEIVKLILGAGVSANLKRTNGSTFLHLATERASIPVISVLLAAGADINARDNFGNTAFELALENKNYQIADYLKAAEAV